MNIVQTRGQIMAEYADGITSRLAGADEELRMAVMVGDTEALLVGMAEREASLSATEDLVGELDLAGLSSAEHAAIIRRMVQALERSQVAQAALEAEMFAARRAAAGALASSNRRPPLLEQDGYARPVARKVLCSAG